MLHSTQTPLPLRPLLRSMEPESQELVRQLRSWLQRPSAVEAGEPEQLACRCFHLLDALVSLTGKEIQALDELQSFKNVCSPVERSASYVLEETLGLLLSRAWSRETALPEFRTRWTSSKPSIGQHVTTSLLLNELFRDSPEQSILWMSSVDGHGPHVWVQLSDVVIDLTRDQFFPTGLRLTEAHIPIACERLLKRNGVEEAFRLLRQRFTVVTAAYGIAATCLSQERGNWHIPEDSWEQVG